jgi:hypothetical protein
MPDLLHTFVLGTVTVLLYEGYTITRFADGLELCARHDDVAQVGQEETALRLGYDSVPAMNRDHDLLHSLLAVWLGHGASPTLRARAEGRTWHFAAIEEEAVLALQELLVRLQTTAVEVAQQMQGGVDE